MFSLQFWKRKGEEPIAQVLKQLQSDINTHEIRVSALRTRQRSITGQITLYSVLIYLAYVVYYALGKNYQLDGQSILSWALKIATMLIFPVLVYGLRMIVRWWYARRIDQQSQEKEALKTRLAEKLEELKEKSDYYNTKQLLERYDPNSTPKSQKSGKGRDPQQQRQPQFPPNYRPSQDDLHQQNLRQRGIPMPPLPPLPPAVTPSTFAQQLPPAPPQQNLPQFHPSAFSPPPSPTLPAEPESKTFLDRVLDLLVGADENAPDQRYALICRHCRAHNGLAPPGEQPRDVGYLCGRCGGWNGPDPNKAKEDKGMEPEENGEENKGKGSDEGRIVAPLLAETGEKETAQNENGK